VKTAQDVKLLREALDKLGLGEVESGMKLIQVGGKPVRFAEDAGAIVQASGGEPLEAEFADEHGKSVKVVITPQAELQSGRVATGKKSFVAVEHLLGLTPVMARASGR